MARKIIDTGIVGNDGTGDSIRDSFRKVNDNFRELYSSLGLGEQLTFIALDDTPPTYVGQNDITTGATPVLTVNNTESGIAFKQLIPGTGISLDFTTNSNEIRINSEFSAISGDPAPQLGGDLRARSGAVQYRIYELPTYDFNQNPPGGPIFPTEAVSKAYADTKISRAGVNGIDPETNDPNPTFGTMTGPLILSRDPEPEDDLVYDGLIAATKRYVDNAGFGSSVNLYVATSGQDDRVGVSEALQGRALAYAYRTIEAALKKAEEIINDSLPEIGPYKKTLTYNNGASTVTLEKIDVAPTSGSGFSGVALLSVENATLSSVGVNYNVGDILTVVGGIFVQPARFQVLTTSTSPGAVVTFRTLSTGVYSALPGTVVGSQRIVTLSATASNGGPTFGASAEMSVTFDVNNVQILSGGSGYGLVSARVAGGGGLGAFGTADIVGGVIQSITITDRGSGFINLPNVIVNLPRFLLRTQGFRTDFTGDVTTTTPIAARSRDIREGLYIRGETSGALAQILAHSGELDSGGNEIFDVDIIYGTFLDAETYGEGEAISYGDVANQTQITVLVESGIYKENYPLRVPQNVSIVGDEFRRVIIRPKPGLSSSPWAFLYFRRDLVIDGLTTATQLFGYHYLQDSSQPVYPLINNKGFYRSAAALLKLNRAFLQEQVVGWIDYQIENNISPFTGAFTYDRTERQKDIGSIIDSMIFDLKYGGSDRTISSGLKFRADPLKAADINTHLSKTVAGIERLNTLAQLVVKNITITELYEVLSPQIVDGAFVAETGTVGSTLNISSISNAEPCVITTSTAHGLVDGDEIIISNVVGVEELNGNNYYVDVINSTSFGISELADLSVLVNSTDFGTYSSGGVITIPGGVVGALITAVINVIENSGVVNYPKDNDQLDVFLANDAVRWQAITAQGHGGFMLVLDPWGQILAKSPYAQECASFSKSTGRQTFAGGMFVDGFSGNIRFKILSKDSNIFLRVGGLARIPNLPASFIVQDQVYRINYIRDFSFAVTPGSPTATSTASFVMDETTPWPFDVVTYNENICRRDVGLIIDGLGYDVVFETNYNARKAGLSYRQANASVVINDQLDITARAVLYAHELAADEVSPISGDAVATVTNSGNIIANIIRNGSTFAPNLSMTNPPGISVDIANAKSLLINNIEYIVSETIGWINAQIAGNTSPFTTLFTYNQTSWAADTRKNIESLIYDVLYGGNSQTRDSARRYYDGVGDVVAWQLETGAEDEAAAAVDYAKYLAKQVVQNLPPAVSYSSRIRATGTPASGTEVALIETLMSAISTVVVNGLGSLPAETLPDLNAYVYVAALKNSRTALVAAKADIQNDTIDWIDDNINVYEVLMPGNRSMLSNDFTQINDMGYGLLATNGGLTEAVSMFTYYCYVSYYSLNGAQIRSVAGSSAHGVYALVAEGSDPLEIPTPVNLYYDLSQGANCYFPSGIYANTADGLVIFVTNYTYVPLFNGELEIDHGYDIFRYTITSVATEDLPPGVARLNLASGDGEGLFAVVPNGTPLTIRQNSQTVLTGDIVEVATRPSTGLVLAEAPTVYRVLQFDAYDDPIGARTCTISFSDPVTITRVAHQLEPNYQIEFRTTGVLPAGISASEVYYVLPDGYTDDSFQIGLTKNGNPVATTSAGSGVHSYVVFGLARTTLRENYNYVDLTIWSAQPYAATALACTITVANPAVVTTGSPHGFTNGDVIRFSASIGGVLPGGIQGIRHYFVANIISPTEFTIDPVIGESTELETTNAGSGTFSVQKVVGRIGDDEFAVVPVGPEESRILGTKFVFLAKEYVITGYDNEAITNEPYALLRIDPPLFDSVTQYNTLPTLKSAVPKGEIGTLTIRISLTRVTGHDLLEIGTGSYADTNYPGEIFGPPVNPINAANETQERDVGRVFYVTTDQFGNFNVGPYFRVDQGTGTVTFSAAIALSNLDGIGFKRGVPVSEFSTDSGFSDNATDTVPTENATRIYVERRLGITHTGAVVATGSLIPAFSGGFMALDGQLAMKSTLNFGDNRGINLANPVNSQDAVNLRSLTWDNFQDFSYNDIQASDIVVFTGAAESSVNATVVGDITFNLRTGVDSALNQIDVQINADTIINADIKSDAAIAQSKLAMVAASTRVNATGITQADRGLASFDDARFTITNGWVTLKTNGTPLTAIAQIGADTVLGNSTAVTGNVTAVTFATVVDEGKALKKSNFTSVGFIRRKNGTSFDGDTGTGLTDSFEIIDADANNTASTLVRRDSNGDFAARVISGGQFRVDTRILADTTTSGGGGVIQLYSYLGQAAILMGDGSLSTDKRNYYDNEGHIFRPQNGVGNAPITCSTINASAITGTGSPSTVMTGTFTLASGSTLQSTYADLAEYYESDREYETGTVLIFGGEKEVTVSNKNQDHRVAGVVSENAALIMNEQCSGNKTLIALQGRVPCRVVGKICKGDLMVTSSIAGVAVSAGGEAKAGTIIGKALEDYDSDHIGTIEVAVGRT
jgi:hypothetical protein